MKEPFSYLINAQLSAMLGSILVFPGCQVVYYSKTENTQAGHSNRCAALGTCSAIFHAHTILCPAAGLPDI